MGDIIVQDSFSWAKFFKGLTNPLNGAKAVVQMIWIGIIAVIIIGVVLFGLKLKDKFMVKKNPQVPFTVVTTAQNAKIDKISNSNDTKKSEFSLFRLW